MPSKNCTLFLADSYKQINALIAKGVKVDHIITDPPYNISKEHNFATMQHPRKGVDFGNWDHGEFDLCSWIPKYAQLLNKNGSIIIFCSYRYISYLINTCESPEAGLEVKDILVWQKSNPMPRNINRRYVQDMEFALWAVKKGAKWTFNKPDNVPYLRSIFQSAIVSGKEKLGHPTQKSLKLMQDLVQIHTNPGDLILDPFMGSGSTGEAALRLGRRFMGIEQDEAFFKVAEQRLKEAKNDDNRIL